MHASKTGFCIVEAARRQPARELAPKKAPLQRVAAVKLRDP
jgi:hypothetical protein